MGRRRGTSITMIVFCVAFIWILIHLLFSDDVKTEVVKGRVLFQKPNSEERHHSTDLIKARIKSNRGSRNADIKETCASSPALPEIPDNMLLHHLLVNRPLNLLYCFVPKAACTFWKRAFYFIQRKQTGDPLQSFFDIGKNEIHTCHIDTLHSVSNNFIEKHSFMNNATKMIIVREPYARLFSAWVDKLFLPDFWPFIGVEIVKRYRENPDAKSVQCGHDVTFEEFLKYVVHIGRSVTFTVMEYDNHWLPISRLCQSCHVDYDVIAKLEDLAHYTDKLLSLTGMDRYLPTNLTDTDTDLDSMWLNIEAYWDRASEQCISHKAIMERLWESFQYQGFLPGDKSFRMAAIMENGEPTKEQFFQYASKLHKEFASNQPKAGRFQRKDFMLKAYKVIPKHLLNEIKNLFHLDFALYGYNPEPVEIFS